MTRRPERVDFDSAHRELRVLLRDWDPIGVFQDQDRCLHAPDDEYDCLIPGLYRRLREGEGQQEVVEFLTHELVYHFGLEPRPQVDRAFASEVLSWWHAREQRQSE